MIWGGETLAQFEDRAAAGVSVYALFPVQMNDGRWVWLQRYWAGLHCGPNMRRWWVRSLDRAACIARPISRPPPPPPLR
jgi:hypothetical protein